MGDAKSARPVIVAALVRRRGRVLMVEQRGPGDPEATWTLPAGRVEPGETPTAAVAREVLEETGLTVDGRPRLLFTAEYAVPGFGEWTAMTFDCKARGAARPNDPDGFVLSAAWVTPDDALARLRRVWWYDAEPLRKWLAGEAPLGATYDARPS